MKGKWLWEVSWFSVQLSSVENNDANFCAKKTSAFITVEQTRRKEIKYNGLQIILFFLHLLKLSSNSYNVNLSDIALSANLQYWMRSIGNDKKNNIITNLFLPDRSSYDLSCKLWVVELEIISPVYRSDQRHWK